MLDNEWAEIEIDFLFFSFFYAVCLTAEHPNLPAAMSSCAKAAPCRNRSAPFKSAFCARSSLVAACIAMFHWLRGRPAFVFVVDVRDLLRLAKDVFFIFFNVQSTKL